jgi:hypothetical protein
MAQRLTAAPNFFRKTANTASFVEPHAGLCQKATYHRGHGKPPQRCVVSYKAIPMPVPLGNLSLTWSKGPGFEIQVNNHRPCRWLIVFFTFSSFRRKPESSRFDPFWMPDQVRHDDLGISYMIRTFFNRQHGWLILDQ